MIPKRRQGNIPPIRRPQPRLPHHQVDAQSTAQTPPARRAARTRPGTPPAQCAGTVTSSGAATYVSVAGSQILHSHRSEYVPGSSSTVPSASSAPPANPPAAAAGVVTVIVSVAGSKTSVLPSPKFIGSSTRPSASSTPPPQFAPPRSPAADRQAVRRRVVDQRPRRTVGHKQHPPVPQQHAGSKVGSPSAAPPASRPPRRSSCPPAGRRSAGSSHSTGTSSTRPSGSSTQLL